MLIASLCRVAVRFIDKVNQKVLKRILIRLGIKDVEVVENGQEAVSRSGEQPFDLILMDMQVRCPQMNKDFHNAVSH